MQPATVGAGEEPVAECPVETGMEMKLETVDDHDLAVQQAAHQLIIQYGAMAAEVARGHARIAEDDDDERAWLDIAEVIDREKVPSRGNGV
jgi:hypothetical protein